MNKNIFLAAFIAAIIIASLRVFSLIGIFALSYEQYHAIVGPFYFFSSIVNFTISYSSVLFIPLTIMGAITYYRAYQGERANKTTLIVWSVILLFAATIAGIIGLVGALKMTNDGTYKSTSSLEDKLKALKALYDNGLITDEEYKERRAQMIEKG